MTRRPNEPEHPTDRAAQLARDAQEAAQVRALETHPDVVALRVEHVGKQVDALLWAGITLGLAFTTVNVQRFAAAGAPPFTALWWAAWLLDPMVSLVLLAVIRAEQITSRHQLPPSTWARVTKWTTFTATYVMNTWEAWGLHNSPPSPAGIVLHSIPPLLVLLAAEAGPGLREQLAHAAAAAGRLDRPDIPARLDEPDVRATDVGEPVAVHEQQSDVVREPPNPTARESGRAFRSRDSRAPAGAGARRGRRMLADYLTDARAALIAASAAGQAPAVTPAWCRAVTGCSAGTSVKLAAALRPAATTGA